MSAIRVMERRRFDEGAWFAKVEITGASYHVNLIKGRRVVVRSRVHRSKRRRPR